MNFTRVKIITTAPHEDADKIRQALGEAEAGTIGDYRYCSFSITGKGRFMPTEQADPHIGKANKLEVVEEEQIEVICEHNKVKQVIAALRSAHPYEEPVVDIVPLLNEEDF
ncbi:MAG TPA: hypothetical protein VFT59_04510 [Candidatus Saccharimonadales bacterium]|nr:hypothetical protein [Candidatus Saccharimonadales bacterium]